jgi:hypothetical protein
MEDEMGTACSRHEKKRNPYTVLGKSQRVRDHQADLDEYGTIILEQVLWK